MSDPGTLTYEPLGGERHRHAGGGPELDDSIAVQAGDVELHHISASEAP